MRALALALFGAIAACAAPADSDAESSEGALDDDPRALQVNDVSILMPLPKTTNELTKGLVSAQEVLPKDLFERAVGTSGPGGTPVVAYADLRVVGIRFDPCFGGFAGKSIASATCQNQMRLVLQPVSVASGAADSAVHAFYSLTRAEVTAALEKVVDLRVGKRLGPLAPHPVMAKEGLTGPAAKALHDLVVANAKNLVRFTTFSSSGLGTAWNFSGFDVASGATTPMVIPTLPAGTTSVSFFRGFEPNTLSGDFTPPTTAADDLQLLGNLAKATANADGRKLAFEAAERVEDPRLHTPDTIDCASCHAAQPAIDMVGTRKFQLERGPEAFAPDERFVPKSDFAQTTKPTDTNDVNVHMFGYKGRNPSIHQRTINESAAIVAALSGS